MPLPNAFGFKSWCQIARESFFGTKPANGFHKFEFLSLDVKPVKAVFADKSLSNSLSTKGYISGSYKVTGTLRMRANSLAGLLGIIRAVTGHNPTGVTVPTQTPTVYDFTFLPQSALESYSFEYSPGDVAAGLCNLIVGMVFTGMTLSCEATDTEAGMMVMELPFFAKDLTTDQTFTSSGSVDFETVSPFMYHHALMTTGELLDGTGDAPADIRLKSFQFSIDNVLADNRFYIGSSTPDKPIRNGILTPSIKFRRELQSQVHHTRLKNLTNGPVKLHFKNTGYIIGTDASPELTITMPSANFMEVSDPINDYGILFVDTTLNGVNDATLLATPPYAAFGIIVRSLGPVW